MRMILIAALALPLAGCLWRAPGPGARPGLGLEGVERTAAGVPAGLLRAAPEPGGRGYLFADSLIAFRTRAGPASVRFRLWNRGTGPVRVHWAAGAAGAADGLPCRDSVTEWVFRGAASAEAARELAPGESREGSASLAARVGTGAGEGWEESALPCLVFDPAQPRAALRLEVESGGVGYVYTFWYRLMEPPREDGAGAPGWRAARPRLPD